MTKRTFFRHVYCRQAYCKSRSSQAFISLPIILLLLFITTLSYGFYQTLADERQWRYQQQDALNNQIIWQAFEMDVVFQVSGAAVEVSECDGFCTISEIGEFDYSQKNYRFQEYDFLKNGEVEKLYWFISKLSKNESEEESYSRLCAQRKATNVIKCWWYVKSEKANTGMLILIGSMPV